MYSKPTPSRVPDAGRFAADAAPRRRSAAPKEPLSAWQRWEMGAFAEHGAKGGPRAGAEAEPAPPPRVAPLAPVLLIDEAELARLRQQAQKAGEAEGHRLGFEQGQAEGHAAGLAAVQAQAEQLQALTQALPAALRLAEHQVGDELLALALDIARQVLGRALAADPEAILPVVQELLQAEPALCGAPQLLLHPDDAALVKQHLAGELQEAGWRIRADAHIQRGGCRVLATSGERDATLETRWERVAATLARQAPTATTTDSR
jgi:flagellar assembly protein FliH